jgi:hypothetical protein
MMSDGTLQRWESVIGRCEWLEWFQRLQLGVSSGSKYLRLRGVSVKVSYHEANLTWRARATTRFRALGFQRPPCMDGWAIGTTCSRGVESILRRLPAIAGNLARALRTLFVCLVRHVNFFPNLSHPQITPVTCLTRHGHIGVRAYMCIYAEHPVRAG